MLEPSLGRRILAGQAGAWALPVQALLRAGEVLYTAAVRLRNGRYDQPQRVARVPVPVISVGNITVGGTGKTPLVIELSRRLEATGRSPVVVARGYGGDETVQSDEELLLRKSCPAVGYVCDGDRHRGALRAVRSMGADVIVLDDAFQHRRLHRDLDIVLLDALCPFGYGHVLPRGLLREPLAGLSRAQLIMITRFDQAPRNEIRRIEATIRKHNSDSPILMCRTRVTGVEYLDGTPLNPPAQARRVLAFAAIGRPQAFAATLSSLGFELAVCRWWPDHHRYREGEIVQMLEDSRLPVYDVAMTTEKDAVKLLQLKSIDSRRIGVVRIGLEFDGDGEAVLKRMIEETLQGCKVSPV